MVGSDCRSSSSAYYNFGRAELDGRPTKIVVSIGKCLRSYM